MSDGRRTSTRDDIGELNRRAVLRQLVLHGPRSRSDIASRVDLTAATLSRIARDLIDAGLVAELPRRQSGPPSGPGRPPVDLDIAPEGGQVLGIAVSPAFQTIALSDLKNGIIAETTLDIVALNEPDLVIQEVADHSRRLIASLPPERRRLLGGFVMLPATVERPYGNVRSSRYLGWGRVPLADRLSDSLGVPMKVESIPVAGALAEARFGAARERDNALVLVCGLGLGVGQIVNGAPVTGQGVVAGGIGLIPITGSDAGTRTFDRVAAGFGILHRLRGGDALAAMSPRERIDLLIDAVARDRDGDKAVSVLMADAGHALGRVVAEFVYLVMPEIVVLSGPLAGSPSYGAAMRATVANAVSEGMGDCPIEFATGLSITGNAGEAACGLGICEHLFERPLDLAALRDSSRRGNTPMP